MRVILFGAAREIVGEKQVAINVNENIATVGDLKLWMKQKYPELQQLKSFAVAVNSEYAEDQQTLSPENEIAIIPPVSGG
ncbi:MAG TPA: molybdopterin converting factor subunit 1 [Segetibacter sp.]